MARGWPWEFAAIKVGIMKEMAKESPIIQFYVTMVDLFKYDLFMK